MSLWRILVKTSLILAIASIAYADIYIYEVVTETRRFQTASKMLPKTFLKYYGGSDVIYDLIIVDKVKGDNFEEAAKQYKLGDKNFRELAPKAAKPNNSYPRHIWWR